MVKKVVVLVLAVATAFMSLWGFSSVYALTPLISPKPTGNGYQEYLHLIPVFKVKDSGEGVNTLEVSFYLKNDGDPVDLTFNTSQKFDYFIEGDGFSYHFADGKVFLQVITPLHIGKGQKVYLGSDTVKIKDGIYAFRAILMAGKKVEVRGKLKVENGKAVFISDKDVMSGIRLFADVSSFAVTDGDNVVFDVYLKNTLSTTVSIHSASLTVDILGGHGSYMAYTSAYDSGKSLKVIPFSGSLAPGESVKIATFVWDQSANVRTGMGGSAPTYTKTMGYQPTVGTRYLPYYIVMVKNTDIVLSVSGLDWTIPRASLRLTFPIYRQDEMKYENIPDWLHNYLEGIKGYIIPEAKSGIDMSMPATRRQVMFGVFLASGLKPISVYGYAFSDIRRYDYMESILEALKNYGIVKGYPDGSVKLSSNITRAETVALMIRTMENVFGAKFDLMRRACRVYKDVSGNEWYTKYVCYADWVGLISGYPDGTFKPQNNVKVSEFAKMLSIFKKAVGR